MTRAKPDFIRVTVCVFSHASAYALRTYACVNIPNHYLDGMIRHFKHPPCLQSLLFVKIGEQIHTYIDSGWGM
jgi:hypothetical protein